VEGKGFFDNNGIAFHINYVVHLGVRCVAE